jgi:hypothetical protein
MGETRAIFFWLSGTFTQPLPALFAQALNEGCGRPVNPLALVGFAAQVEELATGKIAGLSFCQTLSESAGSKVSPEALCDRILEGVIPNLGAVEATRLLPESLERWLVVDLPVDWFERIAGRLGLKACFAPERTVYLPASQLPRLIPDVFYRLGFLAQLSLQDCLLIDASARRAVQALKHGLSTELYVDNRRLERMFVMRKFIDRPQPVHKPATGS